MKYLVAIYKKFSRDILFYEEVEAFDWVNAVHVAFSRHPNLNGNDAWGEAVEV